MREMGLWGFLGDSFAKNPRFITVINKNQK